MEDIKSKLNQLQKDQREAEEIEEKSSKERRKAIEDLEKEVSHIQFCGYVYSKKLMGKKLLFNNAVLLGAVTVIVSGRTGGQK